MKGIRTDLASELHRQCMKDYAKEHKGEPDGIICNEYKKYGIGITSIDVTNENGSSLLGKPCGKYITLDVGALWRSDYEKFKHAADTVAEYVEKLSPSSTSTLVVGLGNRYITADAIGPLAAKYVIATRHIKEREKSLYDQVGFGDVAVLVPGVLAQTGMDCTEHIKYAVRFLRPTRVIIIDSLAARGIETLATTVQITDTGISPGSGVGNDRGELSKRTIGVDTLAIGVPTVVDAVTLIISMLEDGNNGKELSGLIGRDIKSCFVCPKDTDVAVGEMSRLIGYAVNKNCHKILTYDEMAYI